MDTKIIIKNLKFVSVDSTRISEVAWDSVSASIVVRFVRGAVYAYESSETTFKELVTADSPGRYFQANIRNLRQSHLG